MANETVTKSKRFYCVSLIPDICKTPIGPSTPPIPYSIIGEFADAVGASPNVKSQSEPVILHQRSFIPTVKGDEPGTAGGIKSGTTGKRVETKTASSSYRANGSYLVQVGREVWMNDRNTIGKIYERGGELPRSRLQQINAMVEEKLGELTADARAGLTPAAQAYKDKVSANLHKSGADTMALGGDILASSAVIGGAGVVVAATGVGAPVAAAMEATAATGAAVGGITTGAGAATDTIATVLDKGADYILTGKTPDIVSSAIDIGTNLAEAAVFSRLGAAGGWLKKKFPSLGKLFKDKPAPGKKSNKPPPPRPPDKRDGGKTTKKKDEKADPPSDCCPKNAAPGKKKVRSRHPVHFGTGEEILHQADFVLEGAEPLVWTRCYRSSAATQDWGLLGARWSTPFTTSLSVCAAGIVYHDEAGRALRLPAVAIGQPHDNRKEGFVLARASATEFTLTWRDGSVDTFARGPDGWLPHGYQGVNALRPASAPLPVERYLLRRSAGRDGRGFSVEHIADAEPGTVLLHVRVDDGHVVEAMRAAMLGRQPASAKAVAAERARPPCVGRVEEVRADGTRICHVQYHYEVEDGDTPAGAAAAATATATATTATTSATPPQRHNLVRQTDVTGASRHYEYRHHLLTRYTTYSGFGHGLRWTSQQAPLERWSGSALDEPSLLEQFPITLDNSHRARAVATTTADGRDQVQIAYLDADTSRVVEANGGILDYRFDANWLATEVRRVNAATGAAKSLGRREWDRDGMLLAEVDGAGNTSRYAYDAAGNVTTVTDARGHRSTIDYDDGNQPVAVVDALGNTTRHSYDAQGRLLSTTDALGHTTRYGYDQRGRLAQLIDAKGGSKTFSYDRAGRLTSHTDCSGYETRYNYDANNRLSAVIDALGNEVGYQYDRLGRLQTLTREDGTQEHFAYDIEGNLLAHTDANGARTRYAYNGHGMPVERVDALGGTLRYGYDLALQLVELVNANGDSYRFAYHEEGWLTAETGFDGKTTNYTYDRAGQLSAADSAGQRTELLRDGLGQLLAKVTADGPVRYAYDALGRLVAVTAPHAEQRYRYDALGQLLEERGAYYLTPVADTVAVDVGAAAERVADHVFATTHAYDELGNRVQTVLPNGRQVDTQRYGSGHWHGVLWQGSSVVDVERDRLHREKRRKLGTGKQRMDGRRGYDPQSRLVEMTLRMGPVSSDVYALRERSFEYDRAGNLTHMRHGWHSRDETLGTFTYTYDPLGQLLSAAQRDLDEVFAFDPAGNLLDPGPERFQSAWDRQVAEWQKPPAAPPPPVTHNLLKRYRDTAYEYDGQGNTIRKVFERDDNSYAKVELELGYDAENRLVRAVKTSYLARHSAQYLYDAFSRRIAKRVTEERWGNNQACYVEPAAKTTHHVALFVWDGDAMVQELRQGDTVTYLYEPDSFVPLARITSAGGFALDEDAARAEALAPGAGGRAAFHLARIASWHLPSVNGDKEKQAATAMAEAAAEELHLAARRQLEAAANDAAPRDRIDLYSCDHLGTPREVFDGQGRLVWSAKYKAWGKVFEEKSQGIEQPLRFQGQYADAETGLHYNRYRYYDPDSARYLTQDPIGLMGGVNNYQYASNPITWVDPLGLNRTCQKNQPCSPCDGRDPAAAARKWQGPGNEPYLGVDSYRNIAVKKGTVLYTLYPHGDQPGNYFVTSSTMLVAGGGRRFNDAVQVAHKGNSAHDGVRDMRTRLHAYILGEDTCMAEGVARKNPNFGAGGATQFFIENRDKSNLIDAGKIIGLKK